MSRRKAVWEMYLEKHDRAVRKNDATAAAYWLSRAEEEGYSGPQSDTNDSLHHAARELAAVVRDMVEMMNRGDEPGEGSFWHLKAKSALKVYENQTLAKQSATRKELI